MTGQGQRHATASVATRRRAAGIDLALDEARWAR